MAAAPRHRPAGRLAEAESLYRQVLAFHPCHPDGLLLPETLGYRRGRQDLAREQIEQAVGVALDTAPYQANLGKMLLPGRTEAASACLR